MPPCWCHDSSFDTHSSKKYTYQQRSAPKWATLSVREDGMGTECLVEIYVSTISKGRVLLTAATLSPALGKGNANRSVATNSLYALLK